jgi:tetratricopeptide (TPR) repeat protein
MMHPKRWVLSAAVLTFLLVWVVVSLRNDDSTLSVVARYVEQTMCWPSDSSFACMLKTMARYEEKGRYDDAIRIGMALAEKHPNGVESAWIYEDISVLYLRRATTDSGRAEEYLKQAITYRDKALPSASDSPYGLRPLANLSESIGDLSATQRCIQYGNSIKLLDRMRLLADENKKGLVRQFKPDLAERQKVEDLLKWIDEATERVGKLHTSGCQAERPSAG